MAEQLSLQVGYEPLPRNRYTTWQTHVPQSHVQNSIFLAQFLTVVLCTLNLILKLCYQVDYLLGDNPLKMSYMVGYGPRYPRRIHHRGSSLPSKAAHPAKIQCSSGFSFMKSQFSNPNILVGAVVGGPDQHDRFPDLRPDYEQSEPATYINAPLVGSLAYLAHSFRQL